MLPFPRFSTWAARSVAVAVCILATPGCSSDGTSEAAQVAPELKLEGVRFRVYRGEHFARPARLPRPPCAGTPPASPPASSSPSSPGRAPRSASTPLWAKGRSRPESSLPGRRDGQPSRRRRPDRQRAVRASPGGAGLVRGDEPVVVEGEGYRLEGPRFTLDPESGEIAIAGRRTARRRARGKPMTLAAVLVLATLAGSPQASAAARRPRGAGLRGGLRREAPPARPAVRSTGAARAAPGEGPVRVDADEVHYAFQRREVVFTGKPVIAHARGRAAHLRAARREERRARPDCPGVCSGDVASRAATRVVTCEQATYEAAAARLVCEGRPGPPGTARARPAARGSSTTCAPTRRSSRARQITLPGDEVDARRRELEERREGGRAVSGPPCSAPRGS